MISTPWMMKRIKRRRVFPRSEQESSQEKILGGKIV